ncbi:response regulator [bacterium]|nr:response regulator [bacterium]
MENQKTYSTRSSRVLFLKYSVIFGLCYWAMEAVRDVIAFDQGTFLERFFVPDAKALWMRVLVICVILIFGIMADNLRDKRKISKWKVLFKSDWGIFYISVVFSFLYWLFEAFREVFIYHSDSFLESAFSPSHIFLWMRIMAVFFIVLFGLFVQIQVNELRDEEKLLQNEHLRLEKLLHSRSTELKEARVLIRRLGQEIQKRKWLENENVMIQEQLIQAQKIEAIGVVAGGIAHDFNNLMTAILGVSTLALKETASESTLHHDLQEIKVAASRAADLTRQLLLFSREQPAKFAAVDINRTIFELRKILKSLIGEDIQLKLDLENLSRFVSGDKGSLEQMIINLVVNGRDAMLHGGQISIQTRTVSLDSKTCRRYPCGKPGHYLLLRVSDNGLGMSSQIREKIFEPFFTTKSPGTGTGLGLSVVDQIIRKHKGWAHIDSVPGQGTVFSVFLPIITSRISTSENQSSTFKNQPGHGKRILLVEDEEGVREFTSRALGRQGYIVKTAKSAKEARRLFKGQQGGFDLLLSDVVLPDKSGVELALKCRTDFPGLAVLLCSGHNDTKSQWSAIKKHGFPFLKKPFELNELLRSVEEAFEYSG